MRASFLFAVALVGATAAVCFHSVSAQTAPASAPAADSGSAAPASSATSAPAAGSAAAAGRRGGRGARGPQQGLKLRNIILHDPFILPVASSNTYYLYVPGGNAIGMSYYKSKDLLSWDGPYPCFTIPADSWANPSEGLWAPEVHFYQGKYYMFGTLHNSNQVVPPGGAVGRYTRHMRSTTIAVSDSPDGPFILLRKDDTILPHDFMAIDGTFYIDPAGKPWMVYSHEWVQKIDGDMEAMPLKDDLTAAAGDPIFLFKGSDAPWIDATRVPSTEEARYVTDGPEIFRTKDGHLLMLWSSYRRSADNKDIYVETVARSKTGDLKGPWEQLPILVDNDSGHGMLFNTFEGQLMLIIGQPFQRQHAKLYDTADLGDSVKVVKYRDDLSGPELGPQPGQTP
jgi:hypothetical protein